MALPETSGVPGEDEILARLQEHPELLERFKAGDMTALAELVEVGLHTEIVRTSVRLLA